MSVQATPTLTVDGQLIAGDDVTAELAAVEALRLTWGRSSLLEAPTPATAAVTLLDRSPGAGFARRTDLRGRPVTLGWSTGTAAGINFRGRITDLDARPRHRSGGFLASLSTSSVEVDAANVTAAGTSWLAETFSQRLLRLRGLRPSWLFTGGITMPTRGDVGLTDVADPSKDFGDYIAAAAVLGDGDDLLSLLRSYLTSVYPVPLVYDPQVDALTYAPPRRHTLNNVAGGALTAALVPSPARGGRYVTAPLAQVGIDLDAGLLPYDGSLTQPMESAPTRVEVTYVDGGQDTVVTVPVGDPADEDRLGRRVLAVDSIHTQPEKAVQLAVQWARLAAEASVPTLEPITYDSARAGGFDSDTHAAVLLAGRETGAEVFLGRSWLPALGVRPQVGVIGGVLTYAGGEWSLQLTTAPVATTTTADPLRFRYAATPAVRMRDIDRSVTGADLAFVQIGAGFTTATQPPWSPL